MKWCVLPFLAAACLLGQESSSTKLIPDLNGNLVPTTSVSETQTPNGVQITEKLQSINGGLVPRERVEERVIKDDASGRIVERIVHRYDQTGNPGPPEKQVIEEQKTGSGSTTRSTTYRGDISGNMVLYERSSSESHDNGSDRSTETVVERQTMNGLDTVEKKTVTQNGSKDDYQENAVTYRKGENGFFPALKVSTTHSVQNGIATENSAEYEVGSSGGLELHSQKVSRVVKNPDGSQTSEVDLYGKGVPGTVDSADAKLQLKEHDIVEKKPGPGGTVRETVAVRRPTISDPNTLGPERIISETVCRGKCQ
jgi:hypothetical protein